MIFADPFSHGAYILWGDQAAQNAQSGSTGGVLSGVVGGSLKFDIIETETVERDAEITEHPVETGANVTDHYRLKLNSIKLDAFISSEPVDPSIYPDTQGSVQGVELSLPPYPTSGVSVIGALLNPQGALLGALGLGAQQPPTSFVQTALMYPGAMEGFTVTALLGVLDMLRTMAVVVDVATRYMYYPQMLIGHVTTKRDEKTGTGMMISLELKQVLFVSTSSVPAPPTPVQKKDSPMIDKGKQTPTVPKSQSIAHYLKDYFGKGGA